MIQVLKGGLDSSNPGRYSFITGAASDTRLMGVVAMHLVFNDNILGGSFHQFYYYDYEELGLEHMTLLRSDDPSEIRLAVKTAFAGLGASIVGLTERESRYLAQWMVSDTLDKGQSLPPETSEILYLLPDNTDEILLSPDETEMLDAKLCTPIYSDYGIINYYLMRVFGKDPEGAQLLLYASAQREQESVLSLAALTDPELSLAPAVKVEDITPGPHCTFLKNKITLLEGVNGDNKTYRCESIVGIDKYATNCLIVSEIDIYKRKVAGVRKISQQNISLFEAGMLLNKKEYVTVYRITEDVDFDEMSKDLVDFTAGMTRNSHSSGDMYIKFMPDNRHAENKEFMLSDDVHSLYYVTQGDQVIVASYSYGAILNAEADLGTSMFGFWLDVVARYSFEGSLIYDFAESGLNDFFEFIAPLE